MPRVFLRRFRNNGLLRRLAFNTDQPPLPMVAEQAPDQPREPAICQGLVCLTVMFGVYGAYFVTHTAARRVSLAFAPFAFVGVVHMVYLGIYALERCMVIDREVRDRLIESVENLYPVGNFFTRMPPTIPRWSRRAFSFLARSAARAVAAAPAQEEREDADWVRGRGA